MGDWMVWIADLMAEPSPVADAAICGFTDGCESVWASTPGLAGISVEEIKKMAKQRESFTTHGAFLAGRKCRLIRDQMDTDGVFCCDFKTASGDDGSSPVNVCVGKSKQAFVIAFAKKDAGGGALGNRVFRATEHLRKSNM